MCHELAIGDGCNAIILKKRPSPKYRATSETHVKFTRDQVPIALEAELIHCPLWGMKAADIDAMIALAQAPLAIAEGLKHGSSK